MNFTDPIFFCFLLACFLLYYVLPLGVRYLVLLAGSLFFYFTWDADKLCLTVAAGLLGYAAGLLIERRQIAGKQKNMPKEKIRASKRVIFFPAVIALIAYWVLTKTAGMPVIIPVGISYYTLSVIGYLADVYYAKIPAERNVLTFLSFVLWFPKLLQGPIEDFKKIRTSLREGARFDFKSITFGVQLLFYGLFKKLVIADRLSVFLAGVFADTGQTAGVFLLLGFVFHALQLYFDFSGYMDIAEGISEMFGVHMSPNFRRPFFSQSAAEFWRRWHISLGVWFRNYVYMPLSVSPAVMRLARAAREKSGKRTARNVQTAIPLMTVWILTGLWHGTGAGYVIWGLYWGVMIVLSGIFAPEQKKLADMLKIDTEGNIWKHIRMYRTFVLFVIGRWLTMDHPLTALREMLRHFDIGRLFDGKSLYAYGVCEKDFRLMALAVLAVWLISRAQEKGSVREKTAALPLPLRWALYYGLIFAVLIFGMYGPGYNAAAFVYMQY